MYKDEFGNVIVENGKCTVNPNNEDEIIFIKSGNKYKFINGIMDTDNPFMKKVGENNKYKNTNFDNLPCPLMATILKEGDKLRWEH